MRITCGRCKVEMRPGTALANTLAGLPDFPGDEVAVTLSYTGPPVLIKVLKCPQCGRSVSLEEPRER